MQWNTLILDQHATVHASDLAGAEAVFSYQELVCGGLAEEQLRLRPAAGQNSLVWLIWHMSRCEDITLNLAIADDAQVLDDEWRRQLRVDRVDIGTGMSPTEVAELSERVDVDALRAYRLAVGRRSREILTGLDDTILDKPVDAQHQWAADVLGEHAGWVGDMWSNWRKRDFIYLATGHCYQHWGEAITLHALGGFAVGL